MTREELTEQEREFMFYVSRMTDEEKQELMELMEALRKRSEKKED